MRLDSARELKQSLFASPHSPRGDLTMAHARSLAARPAQRVGERRTFALGIAHYQGGRDYRLAVRVQSRMLLASDLLEHIRRQACGEVEIRYIGPVQKRHFAAAGPSWVRSRNRPLRIGCSIGHRDITAGTLGCFVRDRKTGAVMILSNNHVLANENRGRRGDWVLQPGPFDHGHNGRDAVATLERSVRLRPAGATNRLDCAVALLSPGIPFTAASLTDMGRLAGLGGTANDGEPVVKIGRTTGLRHGRVTAFELDNVIAGYDSGDLRFDDQIEIEGTGPSAHFSAGGDSGSLIVNGGHQAIGLLFAGSDNGGTDGHGLAYANPLRAVLNALRVDLCL
jgi:hypothetical protein